MRSLNKKPEKEIKTAIFTKICVHYLTQSYWREELFYSMKDIPFFDISVSAENNLIVQISLRTIGHTHCQRQKPWNGSDSIFWCIQKWWCLLGVASHHTSRRISFVPRIQNSAATHFAEFLNLPPKLWNSFCCRTTHVSTESLRVIKTIVSY